MRSLGPRIAKMTGRRICGNRSAALAIATMLALPVLAQPTASVRLSDDELSFHGQTVGAASSIRSVTLTIRGAAVTFSTAAIGGANPGDFAIKLDTCSGNTVLVDGTCQIGVAFTPVAAGDRDAKLTLADSAPGKPPVVDLSGRGLNPRITRITILPFNPSLGTDARLQLAALALYSDGSSKDVTALARWKSSDPDNARVSNAEGSKGLVTGVSPGKSIVIAALEDAIGQDILTTFVVLSLTFSVQPSSTSVSAAIDPIVRVRIVDNHGAPLRGQLLAMSLGSNPPNPAVLSGVLSRFSGDDGTAAFPGLKLDYLGQGYTLVATAITSGGPFSATSIPFDETRVGDPCLGPNPACSSGCPDADGDGLNDAWEIAGGIDMNGDGKIDAQYDLLLPGAEVHRPDIYVQYDWMDYGSAANACNTDADCTATGAGHRGETCGGAPVPASAHSCSFACTTDSQCTARGEGHAGERCIANACLHTHDPQAMAPGAIDAVVDKFAERGFNLHVERGHALPHSQVLSFRQLDSVTDACEGGSVASGWAGRGNYVESLYDLKARSFDPKKSLAYHYAIFGHYNSCDLHDLGGYCSACPGTGKIPTPPPFGASGVAEIGGNDFIVSMANIFNDKNAAPTIMNIGGTFMHELGHNLGLHHGGGSDLNNDAEDTPTFKPNYLSVMNYKFQLPGILSGAAIGSSVPTSSRLDYSTQTLPTGGNTPGGLNEDNTMGRPGLNEPAGLGSGSADITSFDDGACNFGFGPTNGPLDFDGDGNTTGTNASADLNRQDHPLVMLCPSGITQQLTGHTDWGPAPGQSIFTYKFQCTPQGASDGVTASARLAQNELTAEAAESAHVLYPIRAARVVIKPGCSSARKPIAPGQPGQVMTALFGSADFDVSDVEPSSLKMHGARPLSVSLTDVDGDGRLDLVAVFDTADVRLHPNATSARVTGWLKNSQVFTGEDQVILLPTTALVEAICR